ncbi:MAG: AAA family ATPase [Cyanobacteriota bacterium]|nr:AAA family ATPase [Cyanobacteriota bacterium]
MLTLTGYQIADTLYDGTRTVVYRGVKTDESKSVAIKKLRKEYPTFNELLQFRHQYLLSKNLDFPGIVRPIALEKYGNGYVLVMEDVGGVSLSEYYSDRPLDMEEFLRIAIALIEILENLYRNRVIHKDIKPANILINPETKDIFLIDFSISSLLPRETQEIQNPNVLEGTLAYISPEQTGRMNRGIDYRSDFYSLGVTFYELLTGEVPFKSDDPMELVHCHIAREAIPPHTVKPEIPKTLSLLVMKLMAKTAEERYQSALGIKHDLEKCWQQWQETGSMAEFKLGERDISDRFTIPEKLYGREAEVQSLLDAFDRVAAGNTEMMLVAGFSGIGKTAVVNEVHKPIVRQRGYFIKGKFDQFQRNIPFSAFVLAFRDLMEQLNSESDAQLERWKISILNVLGENGQVIIDAIPQLERIIGQQPPVAELSGSAAQNRFNLLFGKFVRVFSTADHPLVMFIDDLQWADSASLKLMQLLMSDREMGYLLLLGAYRDNEVFPAHPLMLSLDEISKSAGTLNTITLDPLSKADLNRLVADTLSCKAELALPMTYLVHQKTKGNPFFATQFLKGLHEGGWIRFNLDLGYWQCDLTRVLELALTDNVVEFMASRLHQLPEETIEILKLAACIGNQFDLRTLAVVSLQSEIDVANCLWFSLQGGFVLPLSDTYKFFQGTKQEEETSVENISVGYKFLHDRVQQAAYSLIPDEQKKATHLRIGRQLWENLSESEREQQLFSIVNHFNAGGDLIWDRRERDRAARLNLLGSQKAKASVAYEACRRYCYAGQQFLSQESWQENYSLQFALAIATIEAEYFNHNLPLAEELSREALDKARTLLDRIKVRELQILFEINQNQMNEAISLAQDVLRLLGIHLTAGPQKIQGEIESLRLEIAMPTEEIANLATLQAVNDEEKLAAIRVLTNASSASYIANPTLFPAIILHTVRHCMKYGHSPLAASAYSWYGALLCGVYEDIEAGYEFGKLSLQLLEQFNARALTAKVSNMFNVFIRPWKEPLNRAIADLPAAIQSGFDNGDVEYAFYAAVHYCNYLFYGGHPLESVLEAQKLYLPVIVKAQYEFHEGFLRINQQVVINLLGETDEPQYLHGLVLDGESCLSQWLENNIVFLILCFYEAKMRLAYLFEDNMGALVAGDRGWQYRQAAMGTLYVSEYNFYYSLTLLGNGNLNRQQSDRITTSQNQLKTWSKFSPTNFQHKYDLVEAEWHRVLENKIEAMELYDKAIAGAKENEYIQEEALANELAAKFYLDWGKEKVAAGYALEAYYCYSRWGAKAKVEDLEKRYPQLLSPILEGQKLGLTPSATLATMTQNTLSKTTTGAGEILDLATLMKASRTLSENIELEGAIANLMEVVRENAGAETVALMLFEEEVLMLNARVSGEDAPKIDPIPVKTSKLVPLSVIDRVKHSGEPLVLDDASQTTDYAADAYIRSSQPRSVLCVPLNARGQFIGILYLENNQVAGAFTRDRVEVLTLLCSQAAISLENARLYRQSQNSSLQLQEYLTKLQEAQLQLVQSEKMATIGQLVAGIAHEINNPVGFISGNLTYALEYIQDLINLVNLYRETFPHPGEVIEEEIEAIELDYLVKDLPQTIESMTEGTDRIAEISKSMRTFSRSDTAELVPFNLHDGIDSTLLILKHRLGANENRPEIEVVKNYGSLPEINCYPGQLNQVFMNLIANAIDAFDEGNVGRIFEEIKANPNRIAITTVIDKEKQVAMVKIKDNGIGMSKEVKEKIFERLFTTKGVGKGTGLGLSISRQIVEEKHGGKITLTSAEGEGTEFCIALPL